MIGGQCESFKYIKKLFFILLFYGGGGQEVWITHNTPHSSPEMNHAQEHVMSIYTTN